MKPRFLVVISLLYVASAAAQAAPKPALTPEQRTAKYFESIKHDPLALRQFLYRMPKGGDLHNHLSGAVYAESYIAWAAEMGLCVDVASYFLLEPKANGGCVEGQRPAKDAMIDSTLYRNLIDALSMRNFSPAQGSPEYHFFDTFLKFGAVSRARRGDMLAEVVNRAGKQHVHYLELIVNADYGMARELAKNTPWEGDDLAQYREKLLAAGLLDRVKKARSNFDEAELLMRSKLHCGAKSEEPGCAVTVRYQSEIYRALPREMVFAQMLFSFELAKADPRMVSVNPVMPEDWYVPMRDYDLHMVMLDYLHGLYPDVQLSLHAGELAFTQIKPEELGQHIRKAIGVGHAKRIGHGVDVMYDPDADGLLKLMAKEKIAVEINLTSNDYILGVRGAQHPLRTYMKAGVPVVLSTDDEGVSRSDITNEYQRAVQEQGLTYQELKKISLDSIRYSFLDDEGPSLCDEGATSASAKKPCNGKDTHISTKATMLRGLESSFNEFEKSY